MLTTLDFSQLPGVEAMKIAAPVGRTFTFPERTVGRNAAVALIVEQRKNLLESNIICIERPKYEGVHSGQIAFPGGKLEQDEEPLQAAVRETYEEIGVKIDHGSVLGQLTEIYIPPSKFWVTPFVFQCEEIDAFVPDNREVENVLRLPVREVIKPNAVQQCEVYTAKANTTIQVPGFKVEEKIIWGATAMILAEFRALISNSF